MKVSPQNTGSTQSGAPYRLWGLVLGTLLCSTSCYAQAIPNIPSSADIGRTTPPAVLTSKTVGDPSSHLTTPQAKAVMIPAEAAQLYFVLTNLRIEGSTVFNDNELMDLYAGLLGKEISLETLYKIAAEITHRYREKGYFLSLAYIPDQEIDSGVAIIRVTEGFISSVVLGHNANHLNHSIAQSYISDLIATKPLRSDALESFLLRCNDLPGHQISGILSPDPLTDGGLILTLNSRPTPSSQSVVFDNHASRFLGPNQISARYANSFFDLHNTSISVLSGLPLQKLQYGILTHSVVLFPKTTATISLGRTASEPGFTLEPFDIHGSSTSLQLQLEYQWTRQRNENLSFYSMIDSRDSRTDLLNETIIQDNVRVLRVGSNYNLTDLWQGINIIDLRLSKGLQIMGASHAGDRNLSRSEARPDAFVVNLNAQRIQSISPSWVAVGQIFAQWTQDPLLSAEEFGYGGQAFGRAYDASEITGDKGLSGAVELRYTGWKIAGDALSISPYSFYDIGVVYNEDSAQSKKESGVSAGIGIRTTSSIGLSSNLSLAWPVTRDINTPIYGRNSGDPRINIEIIKEF